MRAIILDSKVNLIKFRINNSVTSVKKWRLLEKMEDNKSSIQRAYLHIKQLIFEQRLVPGQKLPCRELSHMLNMSKTPIINALNRLEQEGFVASETFYGYYLKPIDAQEIMDACEVREALEQKAIKLAITLAKDEQMAILEEKLYDHEHYMPHKYDKQKFLLDAQFHLQIATMSGNEVLKYLLRRNLEHVILRARLDDYDPQRMASSAKEHRELVDGMKRKDILGSAEIIRIHIERVRDHILKCLSSNESNALESNDFFA
jgi:DNA-binding GntR family transcriptional regulator